MAIEGINSAPQSSIGPGPSLVNLGHFLLKHHENLLARIDMIQSFVYSKEGMQSLLLLTSVLITSESQCP
jgi:hypothetical protein